MPKARLDSGGNASLPASHPQRLRRWVICRGIRAALVFYSALLRVARVLSPPKRPPDTDGYEILLTGSFHSDNWVAAHLRPLAMSRHCARLRIVSTWPVPPMEKVEVISPPPWLIRVGGAVPARLLTFVWVGLCTRPHVVGGFHLLVNGLVAALLGRLTGARSVYFCVGGPAEVEGGGIASENRLFEQLKTPDRVIERRLIDAVSAFDFVITMGSRASSFFRQRGAETNFHVISGGIDTQRFGASGAAPNTDLILVGRLAPIKRVELFLRAIQCVQGMLPNLTATVIGEGPLRGPLEQLARELGIERNVTFAGYRRDVEAWLRRARVFVLTSDSEGLSLSMMEAMLCGLPAVVSDVGDLSELVEDGVNGYLVSEHTPEAFAARLLDLLTDRERLARFSKAARRSAVRYEVHAVAQLWDAILANKSLINGDGRCAA